MGEGLLFLMMHQSLFQTKDRYVVITGGRDKLVPEETSNDVVKRLNEVKVKTFPDAGHSVPWTHEEDLLTELREFFSL